MADVRPAHQRHRADLCEAQRQTFLPERVEDRQEVAGYFDAEVCQSREQSDVETVAGRRRCYACRCGMSITFGCRIILN